MQIHQKMYLGHQLKLAQWYLHLLYRTLHGSYDHCKGIPRDRSPQIVLFHCQPLIQSNIFIRLVLALPFHFSMYTCNNYYFYKIYILSTGLLPLRNNVIKSDPLQLLSNPRYALSTILAAILNLTTIFFSNHSTITYHPRKLNTRK